MPGPLTPRARAILAAVEREVTARLEELDREGVVAPPPRRGGGRFARREPGPPSPVAARPTPELLAALELGVAGLSREEVAERLALEDPAPILDAVFGRGSAPRARLRRAA